MSTWIWLQLFKLIIICLHLKFLYHFELKLCLKFAQIYVWFWLKFEWNFELNLHATWTWIFQFIFIIYQFIKINSEFAPCWYLHESLVVSSDLEDVEVILGVHELLDSTVVGGYRHHAGQVLETTLAVHSHLSSRRRRSTGRKTTLPKPPWAWPILKTQGNLSWDRTWVWRFSQCYSIFNLIQIYILTYLKQ